MTAYRVPFFEQLRETLSARDVKLSVLHGSPSTYETTREDDALLPWAVPIRTRYLKYGSLQLVCQQLEPFMVQGSDLIIIPHENNLMLNNLRIMRRARQKARVAFFGHGANFQAVDPDSIRERFKAWTSRQADWWFAYTERSRERIIQNGFPLGRITCVNNSQDLDSLAEWKTGVTGDEREALRTALRLRGTAVGLFIGSLYEEKRLPFLMDACDEIRRTIVDFEVVMIGDGPLREEMKKFVGSRPWARYVGAKHGREKVIHLSLGKILLNPGLVGLNALDAFSLGIPMVTTDWKYHSPEIAYLESGRNSLITENNVSSFADGVCSLFQDEQFRARLASAGEDDAKKYSLDNMVRNFADGITQAMDTPPLMKRR
jgi:glycosyltransferase involved in cell wall biosynthesis